MKSRGFTLTEILVVVGIIVLVLGISVPVFRVLAGNNSTGTARNQLSAMLSLARGEAIGLEQTSGVMFYLDPVTKRTAAALVRQAPRPTGTTPSYAADGNVDVYLELVPNREVTLLPGGIGVQTFINSGVITGTRTSDGFMGYNTAARDSGNVAYATGLNPAIIAPIGGVILFDRRGMITSKRYAFRTTYVDGGTLKMTAMGELLFGVDVAASSHHDVRPGAFNSGTTNFTSQIGFAIYDSGAFNDLFGATANPDIAATGGGYGTATTTGTDEASEELWLDKNSIPNLIGRYNGTVIVAQ